MAPFLETGHASVIEEAKKHWRRVYKAAWRKEKRKKEKEVTLSWTREEFKTLKEEAKRHKKSVTRFIKLLAVAYMNQRYITLHEEQVTRIMQLLALTYNEITELKEAELVTADIEKKLAFGLFQLEKDIRETLFSPKTIEQIIKEGIAKEPAIKQRISALIENLQP